MADAEDTKKTEDTKKQKDSNSEKSDEKASGGGIFQWIIMAAIIVLCAGSGLMLGRLFAASSAPDTTESSQKDEPVPAEDLKADDSAAGSPTTWYYDLDPVVANLDEPGVTRYVRAL